MLGSLIESPYNSLLDSNIVTGDWGEGLIHRNVFLNGPPPITQSSRVMSIDNTTHDAEVLFQKNGIESGAIFRHEIILVRQPARQLALEFLDRLAD